MKNIVHIWNIAFLNFFDECITSCVGFFKIIFLLDNLDIEFFSSSLEEFPAKLAQKSEKIVWCHIQGYLNWRFNNTGCCHFDDK